MDFFDQRRGVCAFDNGDALLGIGGKCEILNELGLKYRFG